MKTNCDNCGAVLPPDGRCEYCGTWFGEPEETDVLYCDGNPYAVMCNRGLLTVNEARGAFEPSGWPSPQLLETR